MVAKTTKRFTLIAVGLLLVAALVLPTSALALHAVQDQGRGTYSLERAGDAPEQAKGTLRFRLTDDPEGFHRVRGTLRVTSLPKRAGKVWELWLIDTDKDYNLSIGTFNTDGQRGRLSFRRTFTHVAEFDRAEVTAEPKHDDNPTKGDEVVLDGTLH